ncbi:MAG: hypothetical protein GWN58_33845 [Anaerolineae bacterium]|nr:hypothetical protein [Thermoplasmata archaeon]NIV34262.1 hypothetical protein [Anaerolineae bacterium]NIY06111.1 hypothetical protein [Thermoplasmata archaeon]
MKHVHIKGIKQVEWECDCCHARFPHGRKAPARCEVCGKDLCKSCKRHVHVETGSGNGRPIPEQVNLTRNYCPEHFDVVVHPILTALEVDRG